MNQSAFKQGHPFVFQMGQFITLFRGGIIKEDINNDYDTYGDIDDNDYATDRNIYYECDYENNTDVKPNLKGTSPKVGAENVFFMTIYSRFKICKKFLPEKMPPYQW